MTLVRATAPAPAGDVEVPDEIPRTHQGRPRIAPPGHRGTDVGIKLVDYTRASKLGECLEDAWAIHRIRTRRILFGLSRSPGLYDRAQAVADLEQGDELDEIAALAAVAGGDGQAAMSGTALHLLTERADAGEDLSYLGPRVGAAVATWRGFIGRFEVHGSEQFVVHDELEAAGSYDRLLSPRGWMTAPDGTRIGPDDRLIVDLKSGKTAKYYGPSYKVQQYVYASGVPYSHAEGRMEWPGDERVPHDAGVAPHPGWSLIVHVPLESPGELGLYWVDLAEARVLAEKAIELRRLRREKGLPAAELPTSGGPRLLDIGAQVAAAGSREELTALFAEHEERWTPWLTAKAKRRLSELGVEVPS